MAHEMNIHYITETTLTDRERIDLCTLGEEEEESGRV